MDGRKMTNPLNLRDVKITGNFWKDFMEKVRTQVIPYQWEALNDRIENAEPSFCMKNFRVAAGREEGTHNGCVFQDSDVAKWLEAVAYSLMWHPDAELEATADCAIDDIVAAQQPDGYLNTYYIITDLSRRFTNLKDHHELYCLGHFIEAAVAYYHATGKDKLLNAMIKYVDLVDSLIGAGEGKIHGYPGHEVVEMALIKLYEVTKNEKHLRLAKYFIDERGKQPLFFDLENKKHGNGFHWEKSPFRFAYYQAAEPVREQHPVGHAVRAVYLYSGMADVARETGDPTLIEACERIWNEMTHRQMYVTGAIGSSEHGEAFTYDYDLPNDTVYAETCASIGLAFFAQRMLNLSPKGEYADVLERSLFNGIISGMSADGKSFFYVNPLEVLPEASEKDYLRRHVKVERQKWFGCSCCPPNLARILTSLGSYAYSKNENNFYMHLYIEGDVKVELSNGTLGLSVKTDYPWNGSIAMKITEGPEMPVTVALRVPGWCKKFDVKLDGKTADYTVNDGYVYLNGTFASGTDITLELDMPVLLLESNPRVRENAGKLAVQRGPVIYCLEEADNGKDLHRIYVPADTAFTVEDAPGFFGGAALLSSPGLRLVQSDWDTETLYREANTPEFENISLKWIPYYLWANRGPGEMAVWIRKK